MNADVVQLIDRLEALFAAGRKVPLSAMVMVDEQAFLDIVDQLRVAVPEELRQARRVMAEKDRIISHAQTEADKILRTARAEADRIVSEDELVRGAQDRAEKIIAQADERARDLRQSAESFVLDAFTGLDDELSRLLAQIKRGRAMLERPRDSGLGPRSDADGTAGVPEDSDL